MIKRSLGFLAVTLAFLLLTSCTHADTSSLATSSDNIASETISEVVSETASDVNDMSTDISSEVSSSETSSVENQENEGNLNEETVLYERQDLKKGYVYDAAKILCFGDSFTAGSGTDGGYRYYLFEKLYQADAAFEFVGQYQHNYYNLPSQYSMHLAVGGKKTDEAVSMYTSYVEKYGNDYDIILCMFGINDCYASRTADEILGYYEELLNTIYEDKKDAIIYIASLPFVDSSFAEFNQKIEAFCTSYATENEKEVYFVDMNGRYALDRTADCMSTDDNHPNNSGNNKIASSWYEAIVNRVLEFNDDLVKASDKTVNAKSITLSVSNAELGINERLSLNFEVLPAETSVKTVTWTSSDETVAVVDNYGIVTPIGKGTATITATTLDGKLYSECLVTVVDAKALPTDPYTQEVFDSKFTTTEMWIGDVDMIKTDLGYATTAWVGDSKTITTAKEIDFGNNFMIDVSYSVVGGEEATNDNKYSSVNFGDFKLVISRCAGKIELFKGEESLGSYKYHSITNRFENYKVVYNKGDITVLRGSETLFTAKTDPESVKSVLSYIWNTSWNKATCSYIKVYKSK